MALRRKVGLTGAKDGEIVEVVMVAIVAMVVKVVMVVKFVKSLTVVKVLLFPSSLVSRDKNQIGSIHSTGQ